VSGRQAFCWGVPVASFGVDSTAEWRVYNGSHRQHRTPGE
jgi:hypothetical protein